MINAPCVIIADFEADNKKCDEVYGKFAIDKKEVAHLERKKDAHNKKIENGLILKGPNRNVDEYLFSTTMIQKMEKDIKILESMNDKVWDHCHITVIFHNFCGYDSHLVCESVEKSVNAHQIRPAIHEYKLGQTCGKLDTNKEAFQEYRDSQVRFKETELPLFYEFHSTLSDIWIEFRKISIENDGLDPSHYIGFYA
ncbi:hypothetical protein RCL_jg18181.t1 [Rhizophagus clarus]|uniref:Uncharacterized protein n=1 Tax=Rhizophagus clarus TaxID=94130 RepID=A0A8H3LGX1_9GLOM|nr:hypothetical protein RCL_jg18181.t1 [Rhizophagus clarus]